MWCTHLEFMHVVDTRSVGDGLSQVDDDGDLVVSLQHDHMGGNELVGVD